MDKPSRPNPTEQLILRSRELQSQATLRLEALRAESLRFGEHLRTREMILLRAQLSLSRIRYGEPR